jgi:hypothetical protein
MEVRRYLEFVHNQEKEISDNDENLVINSLQYDLRKKLILAANLNLIQKVQFLYSNFSLNFLKKLALSSKISTKMDQ